MDAFVAEISTTSFFVQKVAIMPSRASFATLYHRKPKLQKRNKHDFWVKRGRLGVFVAENSTASFFCSKSRYNGPPGRVSHRISVENGNSQNATNMSFGSKGVEWVLSLRKLQLQFFFAPKVTLTDLPGDFRTVFPSKTETPKTQQT